MGDEGTVIGERDTGCLCSFHPALHFPQVQHTAAAVNDERIALQSFGIFGKLTAADKVKIQSFAGVLPYPAGQFDSADVLALSMVGAAFTNQNFIAVCQIFEMMCAAGCSVQNSFEPCHKYGKGGQSGFRRNYIFYLFEVLTVGNHQFRRLTEG